MGMAEPELQRQLAEVAARPGPIVAFDFDGTVTVRDSFRAFLRWRCGLAGYAAGLIRLGPAAAKWLVDRDRARLKAAMVRVFLAGTPRDRLVQEAAEFAVLAAPRLLRPDAVRAWRRHQAEGARLVIVTASPDVTVAPFAHALGADLVLGTRLVYDAQDRVAGGLAGDNCRGQEKVRRLKEAFGEDMVLDAAYGDSAGDREMLAMAREGHMRAFTERPATA